MQGMSELPQRFHFSPILENNCDEPFANTSNPALYQHITFAYHHPNVDSIQQMTNHEQMKKKMK